MKKILVDVDGVLLDWEPAFDAWMAERGFRIKKPGVYNQYVRYGFTPCVDIEASLFNGAGLPASAFKIKGTQ